MKKRLILTLCLLLTAALLLSATASAAQIPLPPADEAEIYAVVSLSDGDAVVDEAPGAALMNEAASYTLYVEETPVLLVESRSSAVDSPRFYSVSFTLPGTQTEVFLTGLKEDNVAEIQQALINNYTVGENFELSDLGFIDTEKTYDDDNDDQMCWAASCADMLTYTGWAAKAGFSDEDDVFEAFIDAFTNEGGHAVYALAWFFNGSRMDSGGAQITDYPNSGSYLNDYAFDAYCGYGDLTVGNMDEIAGLLKNGYAIGLSSQLYRDGADDGAHATTMWGYVLDHSLSADDPERYVGVFITDSDSYEGLTSSADRRDGYDVLGLYALYVSDNYYVFDYDDHEASLIYGYSSLAPYSDDLAYETDPAASKDKKNDPDLSVSKLYLSSTSGNKELQTRFESGSTLYFSYSFCNYADQNYSASFKSVMTIADADGEVLLTKAVTYNVNMGIRSQVTLPFNSIADLPTGDYTLTCTVNPDPNASGILDEAYRYNNTMSVAFRMCDSYLLGDYDGNGEINIIDVTRIQRTLAGFTTGLDANASERGDVNGNGLNIVDATLIQRSLAGFTTSEPIGEKQLYL